MANNNETKSNKNTNTTDKGNVKDIPKGAPKPTPKPTPKKKPESPKAADLVTRVRDYLTSVYNELKKVHWPDRRALLAYTAVVLVSVALVSGLLWLLDSVIGFLLSWLLKIVA